MLLFFCLVLLCSHFPPDLHFPNNETVGSTLSCIKTPCRGQPWDYRAGRRKDCGAQRDAASQFQGLDPQKNTYYEGNAFRGRHTRSDWTPQVRQSSLTETLTKCIQTLHIQVVTSLSQRNFPQTKARQINWLCWYMPSPPLLKYNIKDFVFSDLLS